LSKIGFSILPQITPSAFVLEFLLIWQPKADHSKIVKVAELLIAIFWEGMLYDDDDVYLEKLQY
jgi:hypothetical protein